MRSTLWLLGGSLWRRTALLCASMVLCVAVVGGEAVSAQAAGYRWSAVSAGGNYTCGLKVDGSIACWGDNSAGQDNPPAETDFSAVSAGGGAACALRTDGSIACWGQASSPGQFIVPSGHDFTAVSAGASHACALKTDASIVCWGENLSGARPPSGNDFTAISAGVRQTCALRANGSLVCWGVWASGAPGGNDFTAVSASDTFACALKADGSIVCWGAGNCCLSGQLSPPSEHDFTALDEGDAHGCALRADGSIACWGAGSPGTSGYPNFGQASPPSGTDFTELSTGVLHTCALKTDQSIVCWGYDGYGQTDVPSAPPVTTHQEISFSSIPPASPVIGGSYLVVARASSGLPVSFSIDSSSTPKACSVLGPTVSFTGAGSCVIDAAQAGDAYYFPAPQVQQTLTIGKKAQMIAFTSIPPADPLYGGSYVVSATATSKLPVRFSIDPSSTTGACSVSSATVSFTGLGTCVIDADQAGNSDWNPAPQVQQTLTIGKRPVAVTSMTPTTGPAAGGAQITILGSGFLPGDKVVIDQGHGAGSGATAATAVSVDSPNQITATTGGPAKPGRWFLFVIGPDGSIGRAPSLFDYTGSLPSPARITSMSPASGPGTGGTRITILGKGFVAGDTVAIGQGQGVGSLEMPATAVTIVSPTEITATTGGPALPGTWGVWVIAPNGGVTAAPTQFTYTPKVTSVSPTSGPAAGGTHITILGQGFQAGDTVVIAQRHGTSIGALPATAVTIVSPTQITAITGGPAKPGTWSLFVIAPDGTISKAPSPFTYTAPPTTARQASQAVRDRT